MAKIDELNKRIEVLQRNRNSIYDQNARNYKRITELEAEKAEAALTQCVTCDCFNENDKLKERNKDLETFMQQLIWVAEKADTDANEDTTIELARQALKSRT